MVKSFDTQWDQVYNDGKQLNEFPFSDFVSFYFNKFKDNQSKLNILEVGCGAGNNLEFLAQKGHNVYGIDISEKVIEHTKQKFSKKNLSGHFTVDTFIDLPYEDNFFDLIINRAAICHADMLNANIAMKECNRVLNSNGVFYSTFYSNFNTFKATKIDFGFYDSFEKEFQNVGALKFYNIFEITKLFEKNNFDIKNLYLSDKKDMTEIPVQIHSEWIIHANKNK